MMNEHSGSVGSNSGRKSTTDRRVKIGFIVAILIAAGIVVVIQWQPPKLGWPSDLSAALSQAREQNRKVLVFICSSPPSAEDLWMVKGPLSKSANKKAIKDGKFITVQLVLDKSADWAKKYGVNRTPTMLIISPDGKYFYKQEGKIGEVDFRDKFLQTPLKQQCSMPRTGPSPF